MARSSVAARWADIGNLIVRQGTNPAWAMPPVLLSVAAEWLLLGGVTRLVDYGSRDINPPEHLAQLERAGFGVLVHNQRGFQRSV